MKQIQRHKFSILLFGLYLLTDITAFEDSTDGNQEELESDFDLQKRRYDFGLGKRAYSYVSEYKRLPVYDFGLGKRARQYNFGLGKRSEQQQDTDYEYEYPDGLPEEELYDDDDLQKVEKRPKTYSFGLGKRKPRYEFGLGKRIPKYDFGLGKRSKFNFGLGKRERLYNFGLGKRLQSRFNFGLGKRSEEKREINSKDLEEMENSAEIDSTHPETVDLDKQNHTVVPIDSHEIMGHSDRSHSIHKRSIRNYDFGLGKRDELYQSPDEYIRQYRKPYSFGLGKRIPKYDFGLGKRSYDYVY